MSEPNTYINIPMTKAEEERVRKADQVWTGPKLIVLVGVTLGAAFLVLWLSSAHIIGPSMPEVHAAPGALTGY